MEIKWGVRKKNLNWLNFLIHEDSLKNKLKDVQIPKETLNSLINKIFGIDSNKSIQDIAQEVSSKLEKEIKWNVLVHKNNKKQQLKLDFNDGNQDEEMKKASTFALAAGLPNPYFIWGEEFYGTVREKRENFMLHFSGNGFGGSLAQYFAVLSEAENYNYEAIIWNGIGIKNFTEFRGNEFLGYKLGLEYYLKHLFNADELMNHLYKLFLCSDLLILSIA